MEKEDIELLTKVTTSYATVIGVGGATLYYLSQIREIKGLSLLFIIIVYITGLYFAIVGIRRSKFQW
ncbi:hypothetical protein HY498_04280 [Candidatus Woesearchaeota archaeon]|nr:hypothetical protein [Candidatus Woesearchaeota archaeon]